MQPVAMAADVVAAIEAAQQERSVEHLQGAGVRTLGDSHSRRRSPSTPLPHTDVLQRVFGFPAFRDGQLEVVQRILAGRSCLSILPTGLGKSLCYQVRHGTLNTGTAGIIER